MKKENVLVFGPLAIVIVIEVLKRVPGVVTSPEMNGVMNLVTIILVAATTFVYAFHANAWGRTLGSWGVSLLLVVLGTVLFKDPLASIAILLVASWIMTIVLPIWHFLSQRQ